MNSSDITNRLAEVFPEQAYESEFKKLLMFLSEQGPFVAVVCCLTFRLWKDIVVKSKPLGLDFYKAASCQQRHHGDNPQFARDCSQLLHEESDVSWGINCRCIKLFSNYSNSEGRRRKERFESSFISVFKALLCYIDTIMCLHITFHTLLIVDSSTFNCKWIPGYICTCAFRYSYHIMSYQIIFLMKILWYMIETCLW